MTYASPARRAVVAALAIAVTQAAAQAQLAPKGAFDDEVNAASAAIAPITAEAERAVVAGDYAAADRRVLAAFPEPTRTTAQAFVLANVLFKRDPAAARALHERCLRDRPDDPTVAYEAAIDRHRDGDYAAAADAYRIYIRVNPRFAPAQGLLADCLLRLGRTAEATAAWQASERAPGGSLETFESLVCDAHTGPSRLAHVRRAALLARVDAKDLDAAVALIALDAAFEQDWWNAPPMPKLLASDLARIEALGLGTDDAAKRRLDAIRCVVACASAEDAQTVAAALRKSRLVLDKNGTLPADGAIALRLVDRALESEAMDEAQAKAKLAGPALAAARQAKPNSDDARDWFLLAAHLAGEGAAMEEADRLGWAATGDPRFAASLCVGKLRAGALKADDATLRDALVKCPDDATLNAIALEVTKGPDRPAALVRAIEAEFTHFGSLGDPIALSRPRATMLRRYFRELATLPPPATTRAATTETTGPR